MGVESVDKSHRHVLVVEREMITGLGLAEDLLDLGFRVSGPFIEAAEISALLLSDPPEWAIVDLAVKDGTGLAAARELSARNIPLVFFSGGDRSRYVDGEFGGVPWVEKPARIERLLAAVGLDGAGARRPVRPLHVDARVAHG